MIERKGFGHVSGLSYNQLESDYEIKYPTAPNVQSPNVTNENEAFSFNWNMFVYFYIDMHKLSPSKDSKWVDLAVGMCDHFLSYSDDQRVSRGELAILPRTDPIGENQYYQAQQPYLFDEGDFIEGAPGWSSFDLNSTNLSVQILQDGQVLGALSYCADYILSNNLNDYTVKANDYLTKVKQVIDSHDWSWRYGKVAGAPSGYLVAGNWWYPNRSGSIQSGTLPFNHCAGAMQSMLVYNKHIPSPEYINKFNAFMEFVRKDDGGEFFSRRLIGERFWFPYNARTNTRYEDLNHGSYNFTMYKVAVENNQGGFTSEELKRYANSALNAWQNTGKVGVVGERFGVVDVTSPYENIPLAEAFDPLHFAWLNTYSDENSIFKMLRDLAAVNNNNSSASDSRRFRGLASLLLSKPENILY